MNTSSAKKAVTTLLTVAIIAGVLYWLKQHNRKIAQTKQAEQQIFASTAQAIRDAKLLLVNVLDRDEFDDAHIIGGKGVVAINVPFADTDKALELLPKNTPIVTYCSNYFCSACHTVAERMVKAGFTNVKVFSGGMAEWYRIAQDDKKYAFEGPANRPYLKMRVNEPARGPETVVIISAQELQKLIEDITILA